MVGRVGAQTLKARMVGRCRFEFADESISFDQMTSANEEEHMML